MCLLYYLQARAKADAASRADAELKARIRAEADAKARVEVGWSLVVLGAAWARAFVSVHLMRCFLGMDVGWMEPCCGAGH